MLQLLGWCCDRTTHSLLRHCLAYLPCPLMVELFGLAVRVLLSCDLALSDQDAIFRAQHVGVWSGCTVRCLAPAFTAISSCGNRKNGTISTPEFNAMHDGTPRTSGSIGASLEQAIADAAKITGYEDRKPAADVPPLSNGRAGRTP